jgi:hypothetical protein
MLAYLKAIAAGLVAGLSVIATSLDDSSLTAQEWVYAAIALIVGSGVVAAVPNKQP